MPATMTINDAIDALNNAAKRQTAEKNAANAVSEAKTRLVLSKDAKSAFFATLALRLKFSPDWTIDTAATDGRRLLYNPDFLNGLTTDERIGLLAHEVMHCACKHFARRAGRDASQWNVAADLAINPLLIDAGFTLPADGLHPGKGPHAKLPANLSAEEYFTALQQPPQDDEQPQDGQSSGSGDGQPGDAQSGDGDAEPGDGPADPGQCGGVIDPTDDNGNELDDAQQAQLDAEWSVNLAAAAQAAKRRGTLSAGLERIIGEALAPVVNWKEALREFITRPAKANYSWKRPSRRHLWNGLFLPSLHSLEIGSVVIAVDTSGSIDEQTLRQFAGEIEDVAAQGSSEIKIVFHDSDACHVQTWNPADGPLCLESKGGGGTSHKFLPKWIEENCDEPPAVLICLTDAYTEYPTTEPICPTLWAVIGNKNAKPPFGETIHLT